MLILTLSLSALCVPLCYEIDFCGVQVARKSGRSKDDLIYLDFAPPRVGIGIESRVPKMRMP